MSENNQLLARLLDPANVYLLDWLEFSTNAVNERLALLLVDMRLDGYAGKFYNKLLQNINFALYCEPKNPKVKAFIIRLLRPMREHLNAARLKNSLLSTLRLPSCGLITRIDVFHDYFTLDAALSAVIDDTALDGGTRYSPLKNGRKIVLDDGGAPVICTTREFGKRTSTFFERVYYKPADLELGIPPRWRHEVEIKPDYSNGILKIPRKVSELLRSPKKSAFFIYDAFMTYTALFSDNNLLPSWSPSSVLDGVKHLRWLFKKLINHKEIYESVKNALTFEENAYLSSVENDRDLALNE